MAQVLAPISLGSFCATCQRLTGENHRMEVYPNGYLCQACKTFLPSKRERGRTAIGDNVRMAGFFLLIMATFVLSQLVYTSMVEWLCLLAGYSFYFVSFFTRTREILQIV